MPSFEDANSDLEPRVVSIGTCRALRIRQVGRTFLVENNQPTRDERGDLHDHWKVVAVVKPDADPKAPSASMQAHKWLADANRTVLGMTAEDMRRKNIAAARGTD